MIRLTHPFRFYSVLMIGLLLSVLFGILPMAGWFALLRPELVCLLLIFWILQAPDHIGLSFAFFAGLLQDVVELEVWGAHALALVIVSYILISSYQRFKSYSVWRQTLWVAVLVGLHQVLVNWVHSLDGYGSEVSALLASTLVSAMLWPVFYEGGRRVIRVLRLL